MQALDPNTQDAAASAGPGPVVATDTPNSVLPAKPAIASTTVQGSGAAVIAAAFIAAPVVIKLYHREPVNAEEALQAWGALVVIGGAATAIYGRFKATHPISGIFKVRL